MARAQKQKAERQATAAYAASQPLYRILHDVTTTKCGQQKANLMHSREVVQNIHVLLPNPGSLHDTLRHEKYVDCIVKAFRIAADTYASLFNELAKITTANPDEGKAAGAHHEDFKAMMEVAKTAKMLGAGFITGEEQRAGIRQPLPDGFYDPADDSSEASSRSEDEAMEETPMEETPKAQPTTTELPSRKRQHSDESAPAKKRTKLTEATDGGAEQVKEEPKEEPDDTQFEDLSAEVERRMKAKAEKKQAEKDAKKAEKKRKRESDGSELKVEEAEEAVPAVEKPKKKKSKKAAPEVDEVAEPAAQPGHAAAPANDEAAADKGEKKKKKKRKTTEVEDATEKSEKKEKKEKREKTDDAAEETSESKEKKKAKRQKTADADDDPALATSSKKRRKA